MRQIKLDSKKARATIDLSSLFYPKNLLQLAAAEYAGIANVSIKETGNRLLVEIKPKEGSAEQTALHFCNFALGLKRELGQHA